MIQIEKMNKVFHLKSGDVTALDNVTLNIGDHELGITSVTVQAWAPVTVDGTLDAD